MRWLALAFSLLAMPAFSLLATPAFAQTPVFNAPVKINALDIATVTTGGTAVVAINPGNRTMGGWLHNPGSATVGLCINEVATASGTSSSSSLTCIPPGFTYGLRESVLGVSVVTSDSAHPFSGFGFSVPQ